MSEDRMTADEFARLLELPASHPDRRRAETSAEFAAMKALHEAFRVEAEADASGSEAEAIRAELARRVRPAAAVSPGASPAPERPRSGDRDPWLFGLLAALTRPAGRWAITFAAIVVVSGLGWWSARTNHRDADVLRGDRPGAFELQVSPLPGRESSVHWSAVPGADAYRVIVLGRDLAEVARVELGNTTEWRLRADSLPGGTPAGSALSVEVQALQRGVIIATTPARTVRLS